MSSSMCKKAEGAIFPLLVKTVKDGVDDALDAGQVHEPDHRACPSAHLDEASFDDVGGTQLPSQVRRKLIEREQVRQIAFEPFDDLRIGLSPTPAEHTRCLFGCAMILRVVDSLRSQLYGGAIAAADALEKIAHLVDPAALMSDVRINGLNSRSQSGAAVGDDQL